MQPTPKEPLVPESPPHTATITVQLNGEPHTLPAGSTVRDMMAYFGYTQTGSAVAINLTFVPTKRYDTTIIHDRDTIDILGAIYGG